MGTAPCEVRPIEAGEDTSRILFARPSVIEGAGRIFDLGGTLSEYNRSEDGDRADYWALWADWYAIGADIKHAARIVMGDRFLGD